MTKVHPTIDDNAFLELQNNQGMRITISRYGAALVSWWAKDRSGQLADILLGYADQKSYANNSCYFGSTIGRWANRIAAGRFKLDGVEFQVECNENGHHLHGGTNGLHSAKWEVVPDKEGLRFRLDSPAGNGGFPGNLHVEVSYRLDDDGTLMINYEASSDAPTPLNLTSHPYFNLNGSLGDIGKHELTIYANTYLSIDQDRLPVTAKPVQGVFDFRQPESLGNRLTSEDEQLVLASGYDHCFCLNPDKNGKRLRKAAHVVDPESGRQLAIAATAPGLQFYSGNFLDDVMGRKDQGRKCYAKHDGFCLEPQAFPNQINFPDAESVIVRPGQVYRQTTTYRVFV